MMRPLWSLNEGGQRLELMAKKKEPCSGCGDGEMTTYLSSSPSETIKVQVHGPTVIIEFLRPLDNEGHEDGQQQQANNDTSAATSNDPHPANVHSVKPWSIRVTSPDPFNTPDSLNQVLEDVLDMESEVGVGVDMDANTIGRRPCTIDDLILQFQLTSFVLDSDDGNLVVNDVDYMDIEDELLCNVDESFQDFEFKDDGFLDENDFSEADYQAMRDEWWGLNQLNPNL